MATTEEASSSPKVSTEDHVFLYSTHKPLTTFPLFSQLPATLRTRIYELATPPPRTHFVEIYHHDPKFSTSVRIRYIPPLPALYHATSESRSTVINLHGGQIIHFRTPPQDITFHFNFHRDILFLSSRFSASGKVMRESTRLSTLESLLPYQYLVQLRRIVVTFSALDDFDSIALSMRWLKQLETLYVAMMDWWSHRDVRRELRRGRPTKGVIKGRIEQNLADLDGEETDVEEEEGEEEDFGTRNMRVVEVELRLDEPRDEHL